MTRRLNYDNSKPSWPCRCGHVHQRTTLPLCCGSGRWDTETSGETTVDVEGGKEHVALTEADERALGGRDRMASHVHSARITDHILLLLYTYRGVVNLADCLPRWGTA